MKSCDPYRTDLGKFITEVFMWLSLSSNWVYINNFLPASHAPSRSQTRGPFAADPCEELAFIACLYGSGVEWGFSRSYRDLDKVLTRNKEKPVVLSLSAYGKVWCKHQHVAGSNTKMPHVLLVTVTKLSRLRLSSHWFFGLARITFAQLWEAEQKKVTFIHLLMSHVIIWATKPLKLVL